MIKPDMGWICPGKGADDSGEWVNVKTRGRGNEANCPTWDNWRLSPEKVFKYLGRLKGEPIINKHVSYRIQHPRSGR